MVPAKALFPVTLKSAEVEAVPPTRRSMVALPGYKAPDEEFQKPLNAQLAVEIQMVPVLSGNVIVLAAVAADARVVKKLVCPAN